MRVAITGATGLIGRTLVAALAGDGHEITAVSRSPNAPLRLAPAGAVKRVAVWDPATGRLDPGELEGSDVVVHLAGETIAGLWTPAKRARIRESRVRGTELLCGVLARLVRPPSVLLSASAVGYYGHRPPDTPMAEDAEPGAGFLAETVVAWEAATRPAEAAGIRTVRMRFGLVLSPEGGLLASILPLFRLGLGARLGDGTQAMSWVALAEIPGVVRHLLAVPTLSGPVNVVAPEVVTNAEFTRMLAAVLGRPARFTVPAFLLRALPGRMADEMLLSGARAVPRRLEDSGYRFAYPELEPALREMLGRER